AAERDKQPERREEIAPPHRHEARAEKDLEGADDGDRAQPRRSLREGQQVAAGAADGDQVAGHAAHEPAAADAGGAQGEEKGGEDGTVEDVLAGYASGLERYLSDPHHVWPAWFAVAVGLVDAQRGELVRGHRHEVVRRGVAFETGHGAPRA